ncbi:preprotein translocase subunit SecG [Sphingomonas sanguinis]|jgi:preprotein translocase subunit SecG|uniref:preprotein translocase subunit SecG n=1 Tax=Sphingomonas sp. LC-1 TaxID=3110957 RepID=UPI0021BA5F60|nr:preprotein translocase subunit SecG [Sphingomonas sp. LC-1]MCT8000496.1 preprotein translocase subunit SecG [Sphingomonas sp. LC-1]
MFAFLLVIHALIAATLVTVILMQKSEGGGLGMGGSPSGLMSARGAADFLSRATAVLATLFVGFSILLAVLAATRGAPAIDTSLARTPATQAPITAPAQAPVPTGSAAAPAQGSAAPQPADNSAVPLAR